MKMKNKNCYIAGKIGDLPKEIYELNFEQGKLEVQELGMNPISPVDLPHSHGMTWAEYMREDVAALMTCGTLYALRNWHLSPGATKEIQIASMVGINIIYQ